MAKGEQNFSLNIMLVNIIFHQNVNTFTFLFYAALVYFG